MVQNIPIYIQIHDKIKEDIEKRCLEYRGSFAPLSEN